MAAFLFPLSGDRTADAPVHHGVFVAGSHSPLPPRAGETDEGVPREESRHGASVVPLSSSTAQRRLSGPERCMSHLLPAFTVFLSDER